MKISIPREIKNNEFRVAITPAGVRDLVSGGHDVSVETGAGAGSQITDEAYQQEGARIVQTADECWGEADMVVKVKEPVAEEYRHFRDDLTLFAFLHLAAEPELTKALMDSGMTAIAYETVQLPGGGLPLLAPMSEVAGRLASIVGAHTLLRPQGGSGQLVPGVPGTRPAHVVILGGGVAGTNAMSVAVGLGARVSVLDTNLQRLKEIDALYAGRVTTLASNSLEIERAVTDADLVIGSVLIPGAKAPKLVSLELVSKMKPGSVLVDIAVDQGGCFEGSKPTTHDDPTFAVHNSVYYCVANMPGAAPATSTAALTNATMPYLRQLANKGWKDALKADAAFASGLSTHAGALTNQFVGDALGIAAEDAALHL
ncbi:alanine dehydrogenase [Pontimonas sp.]|uniref:alanine dehydrogenase n=1 Tax=Pontimonas sp. TaxID=2304492 RepID=UPI002870A388|nr:alanine dehydrogenase [Pontimonas sp.]MDR9396938.1 alanine dehydrogenase [Pontimonas sp.]MDR9435189.1 alanine dehydrogenase [Pontimonas sp.]